MTLDKGPSFLRVLERRSGRFFGDQGRGGTGVKTEVGSGVVVSRELCIGSADVAGEVKSLARPLMSRLKLQMHSSLSAEYLCSTTHIDPHHITSTDKNLGSLFLHLFFSSFFTGNFDNAYPPRGAVHECGPAMLSCAVASTSSCSQNPQTSSRTMYILSIKKCPGTSKMLLVLRF